MALMRFGVQNRRALQRGYFESSVNKGHKHSGSIFPPVMDVKQGAICLSLIIISLTYLYFKCHRSYCSSNYSSSIYFSFFSRQISSSWRPTFFERPFIFYPKRSVSVLSHLPAEGRRLDGTFTFTLTWSSQYYKIVMIIICYFTVEEIKLCEVKNLPKFLWLICGANTIS